MYGEYVAICKTCNTPNVNVLAGAVCPNGCGPVYKSLKPKDAFTGARALVEKAKQIPSRTKSTGKPIYEIEGRQGEWLKVGVVNSSNGSLPVIPPNRKFGKYVCQTGDEIVCIFEIINDQHFEQRTFE